METAAGSVLCDPWVTPAFFGSWFPFPDNRGLDWDRYGRPDYLYISHRHADHFDPELLAGLVDKRATVLLPDYPTGELERELRALGFDRMLRMPDGQPVERDGLRLMVTVVRGPGAGPLGDSALSVDDGTASILDQNDSHPMDIQRLLSFGPVDVHLTQFSGAIWWPMVYDLPAAAKRHFAELKRRSQTERTLRYVDQIGARHVVPIAGPPAFYDDDLFEHNGWGLDGSSIFTNQAQFLAELARARPDLHGHLLLPGTELTVSGGHVDAVHTRHTARDIAHVFGDAWAYLREQQAQRQDELEQARAALAPVPHDLFEQLRAWWEPLMQRAHHLRLGVGGPVRFDAGELALLLDFPAGEVRRYAGESVRYRLSTSAALVATNLARREVDWSNSLFLSLRFRASRVGKFNEFLYTFFKCLSVERIDYIEDWYDQQDDMDDTAEIAGWRVQRRCPHQRADLAEFGTVEGEVLTCHMHGWRFDLRTGQCISSGGYAIRAERPGPCESRTAGEALTRPAEELRRPFSPGPAA
ncbi:MAG TPA: Rieske 2Fe-2S domain-containing protein [Intrasporangium sp.]|nr:Rieske 2Fe-2S domain-containing protein [Intrasporangium sp.]